MKNYPKNLKIDSWNRPGGSLMISMLLSLLILIIDERCMSDCLTGSINRDRFWVRLLPPIAQRIEKRSQQDS